MDDLALRKAVIEIGRDARRIRDLGEPMEYTELRDAAFEMLAVVEAVPALLARLNEAEGTVRDMREVATRMLAETTAGRRAGDTDRKAQRKEERA